MYKQWKAFQDFKSYDMNIHKGWDYVAYMFTIALFRAIKIWTGNDGWMWFGWGLVVLFVVVDIWSGIKYGKILLEQGKEEVVEVLGGRKK